MTLIKRLSLVLVFLFLLIISKSQRPSSDAARQKETEKSRPHSDARIYTAHFMLAFWDFIPDKMQWFRQMKAAGYNQIWAYLDGYDGQVVTYKGKRYIAYQPSKNIKPSGTTASTTTWHYIQGYVLDIPFGSNTRVPGYTNWDSTTAYRVGAGYGRRLFQFLDTAYAAGMPVMVGCHGASLGYVIANMYCNVWNHPALAKYNGKVLFANYMLNQSKLNDAINYLQAFGISHSQYTIVAYPGTYPWYIYYGKPPRWADHYSAMPFYKGLLGQFRDTTTLDRFYQVHPNLDGIINFSADKGGMGDRKNGTYNKNYAGQNSYENSYASSYGAAHGKLSIGGITPVYASAQYYNLGFYYVANMWQDILEMPVSQRPIGMCDVTANDYVELSYMSPAGAYEKNGLLYFPKPNSGFTLGYKARYPLADHSGMAEFTRPYAKAFLHNASAPIIDSEAIFYSYYLHPVNPALQKTVPDDLKNDTNLGRDSASRQAFWLNTGFAKGRQAPQIGYSIGIIQDYLYGEMDTIYMGAHLLKPGFLKINNTISKLLPAGVQTFAVKQAMGIPVFAILNPNGTVRKECRGVQPITNNSYPGGWNNIILKGR